MRLGLGITGFAGWALLGTLLFGGCFAELSGDCRDRATCPPLLTPFNPDCVPSTAKASIPATCGIFVSTTGEVNSINQALELLAQTPRTPDSTPASIYVCAEAFDENVALAASVSEMSTGVRIFGGLDCANDWRPMADGTRTVLNGMADGVPLRVDKRWGETGIAGFEIRAKDATLPGASSIGIIATDANIVLFNVAVTAGNGANGEGGDPAPTMSPATAGADGPNGVNACDANSGVTPLGPTNACADTGGPSIGGDGGPGGLAFGIQGWTGVPGADNFGAGESMAGAPCVQGMTGVDGMAGMAGSTPNPMMTPGDKGVLDAQSGYKGLDGGDGTNGTVAQGGGGGGSARSRVNNVNQCPGGMGLGASGGAGGSGGCGGVGGKAGKAGGSSIAIVSIGSTLQLSNTTLTSAQGGAGGLGASGQVGGAGGLGGVPGTNGGIAMLKMACAGGVGGKGGEGGKGGDGAPGHSIGIAFSGTAPSPGEGVSFMLGGAAPNGLAANTQAF